MASRSSSGPSTQCKLQQFSLIGLVTDTRCSIWGVADGARIANVDSEIVAYAILDVLAKPIFGFWLLFTHDSMASTSPSLEGFWAKGFGGEGQIRVGDDDEGA